MDSAINLSLRLLTNTMSIIMEIIGEYWEYYWDTFLNVE